jgi:hypothetical protein
MLTQNRLDVGNRNVLVEGFLELHESCIFDRGDVLTCRDQLSADVENRVTILVERVDDIFSEGKLVRVADHRPVLKEVARCHKYKNQNQGTKNVVLEGASCVTPKDDFVYSRHSFRTDAVKTLTDAPHGSVVSLQILISPQILLSPQRTRRSQRIREVVHDSPNTILENGDVKADEHANLARYRVEFFLPRSPLRPPR